MDNCCGCGSNTLKVWQLFQSVHRSPLKGGDNEYYDKSTIQVTVHRLSGNVTYTRVWEWDHRANLFRRTGDFSGGQSAVDAEIQACATEKGVSVIHNSAWTANSNTSWTQTGTGEGGTPAIYTATRVYENLETVQKLRGMVGRDDWDWSDFEGLGEGIWSRTQCWDETAGEFTTQAVTPSLDPFAWYAWAEREIVLTGTPGSTYPYVNFEWYQDPNIWGGDSSSFARTSGVVELAAVRLYKVTTWCQGYWSHEELLPQTTTYNTTGGATCGWNIAMTNDTQVSCWKYPTTADQEATADSELIEASEGTVTDPHFTLYPPASTFGYVKIFAPDWLTWAYYGFGTPPAWVSNCEPCVFT